MLNIAYNVGVAEGIIVAGSAPKHSFILFFLRVKSIFLECYMSKHTCTYLLEVGVLSIIYAQTSNQIFH